VVVGLGWGGGGGGGCNEGSEGPKEKNMKTAARPLKNKKNADAAAAR